MIDETRYIETPTLERSRLTTADATTKDESNFSDYVPRFISWSPIWAGVAVAIGVHVLLSVLGMAVGLSVAAGTDASAQGIGISVGIWMIISALAALFIGGWIAGVMAAPRSTASGVMHGFILWCVVTALSAVLMTLTGSALAGGGLAALADSAQQSSAAIMGNDDTIARQDPFTSGSQPHRDFSQDSATKTTAGVAWWTFAVLLLSAGAAAFGGSLGHRPVVNDRYNTRS